MEKKPEQHLAVNEAQSEQEQLEEALRARIDAARRAADYLAELFGIAGGRPGEAVGKRGEGTKPGMGAEPAAGSPVRSPSVPPAPSPDLSAYPAAFKRCLCGRSYTAEQWRDLVFAAFERMSGDLAIEMRECGGLSVRAVIDGESVGLVEGQADVARAFPVSRYRPL
jgi:hypothetical protein